MTLVQNNVTGWVYSFTDYEKMYGLTEDDLAKSILDFPGMVSSFNALATKKGAKVLSASPLFEKSAQQMQGYVEELIEKNVIMLKKNLSCLQNPTDDSFQEIVNLWAGSAKIFMEDYATGKAAGRYFPVDLKRLPFASGQFDLVLCSHLLFQSALPDGVSAVRLLETLCDIAEEVRLYPLLDVDGKIADDLGPLMLDLQQKNYGVEVREVNYEHRKGGNAMLRIWAQSCLVG